MSGDANLHIPEDLKERIERVARQRDQNSSTVIASALDLLLETEELQSDEARQRLASASGTAISNEAVMRWLETWGMDGEISPPRCE